MKINEILEIGSSRVVGLTLVPESDKRPAFNAAADDFKDI